MQPHKTLCAFKMLSNHTKDYNSSWCYNSCYTLQSTFNCKIQANTTSPKNFIKALQLIAKGIHNKTDEIQGDPKKNRTNTNFIKSYQHQ